MSISLPHIFASLSGSVPASYLDDNFNALASAAVPNTTASIQNLTVTQQANYFAGFINPTITSGFVNDWSPTGYDSANYVRIGAAPGAAFLTGYGAGTSVRGRTILLENSSGQIITLVHNSTASASANRFFTPDSHTAVLGLGQTVILVFTGGGWRVNTVAMSRTALNGPRTYFVSPTGNDSNDGLSSGTALQTVQQAVNLAAGLDLLGNTVTIQLAAGTYPGNVNLSGSLVGQPQASNLVIVGDNTTPSNVVFSFSTSGSNTISMIQGAKVSLQGITFAGGASLFAHITCTTGARVEHQNCVFGQSGSYHLFCYGPGATIEAVGPYKITSGAPGHLSAQAGAMIRSVGQTVTLTGTPAFSAQFAIATANGYIEYTGITFSGSATGARYLANSGGGINTAGGGANYFPGNAAGTATSPGWYA